MASKSVTFASMATAEQTPGPISGLLQSIEHALDLSRAPPSSSGRLYARLVEVCRDLSERPPGVSERFHDPGDLLGPGLGVRLHRNVPLHRGVPHPSELLASRLGLGEGSLGPLRDEVALLLSQGG